MSNYNGGMLAAKIKFLEDLKDDKDFLMHKNNALSSFHKRDGSHVYFGTAHVYNDHFCTDKQIGEIVKRYLKK